MKLITNDKQFMKDMNNFIAYAEGFLDGAKIGKPTLMRNIGEELKVMAAEYIDASARVNPRALHHVYEWYQVGSPAARLFDISYTLTGGGLTVNSTLKQSTSISSGSNAPFYDKARIMESGIPVTIRPVTANVLAFEDNGEQVFTKGPVNVTNPGGDETAGSFAATLREFFQLYASQSLMFASGLDVHLKTPTAFKQNTRAGVRGGRSVGLSVGKDWISGGIRI